MGKEGTGKQGTDVKSLQGKKIVVRGLDTTEEQILQWDQEGYTLVFDTTGQEFRSLREETVQKLSRWNADRYRVSAEIWEEAKKRDPVREVLDGIEFGPNRGTATDRLKVERRNPNYVYWWEVPERVYDKVAQGWEVVQGSGERTIHSDGSRIHRIGKKGEEETILLRLPKEVWQKRQREKVERYQKGILGVGSTAATAAGANPRDLVEGDELERMVASGKVAFKPVEDTPSEESTR